jgi:hypothetical protein
VIPSQKGARSAAILNHQTNQKIMNLKNIKIFALRVLLIASIILTGECAVGQKMKNFAQRYQLGLEASFGIKSFKLNSDIAAINNLHVIAEGGTAGLTVGSGALKAKIRQGYYYSASNVGKTIDQVRSAAMINFYPMQLLSDSDLSLQPYMTFGVERNILKMYGFYGPDEQANTNMNYSISEAPYLGKIITVQASVGAGLEFSIKKDGHFVSIFSEVKYGKNVAPLNSTELFKNTTSGNQLTLNVGVGFGYHK